MLLDLGTTVANSGGTVTVDGTGTLTLNSATIDGGTVTNKANGAIDLTGTGVLKNGSLGNAGAINVSGTGNVLDNEIVTNTGAGAIGVTGTLTLDLGTSIIGGTLTNSGTVEIEILIGRDARWRDGSERVRYHSGRHQRPACDHVVCR